MNYNINMETFSKCYIVAKRASTKSFKIWGRKICQACHLFSPSNNLAIDWVLKFKFNT